MHLHANVENPAILTGNCGKVEAKRGMEDLRSRCGAARCLTTAACRPARLGACVYRHQRNKTAIVVHLARGLCGVGVLLPNEQNGSLLFRSRSRRLRPATPPAAAGARVGAKAAAEGRPGTAGLMMGGGWWAEREVPPLRRRGKPPARWAGGSDVTPRGGRPASGPPPAAGAGYPASGQHSRHFLACPYGQGAQGACGVPVQRQGTRTDIL